MSRIFEAMKRAGEERLSPVDSRQLPAQLGPAEALPERVQNSYQRLLQSIEQRLKPRNGRAPVILVVSAIHGEGASTVVRNLANTACNNDERRVLLIDANLRTPQQHEAFGVSRSHGLSELLARSDDQPPTNGFKSGMTLITSGRPTENPSQMLSSDRVKATLDQLQDKFDWIFVDGPPATLYAETAPLARMADGVVLVVRAEKTRREVGAEAKRLIEQAGGTVLGAVLNRTQHYIPRFLYKRLFGGV